MITLSTDRGLTRIETWSELLELPGFVVDVDPRLVGLKGIIGSYQFREKQKCGLSTCHQPHNRGYVVTTENGRLTNIGKDCGATHFLVDFESMRRNFDRDVEDAERREFLNGFKAQIPDFLEYISLIRSENTGADWIYRQTQRLINSGRGVPNSIVDQVWSLRSNRTGTLTAARYASEAEVQRLEAAQGKKLRRPHYVTEEIGQLDGVAALFVENDLRELLVIDLEQGLSNLQSLDIESLTRAGLRQHASWAANVPNKIGRADAAVKAGRRLLKRQNLSKLSEFAEGFSEFETYQAFLGEIPD